MVFDPSVFIEAIEQAAEDAVKAGLSQITERARHKAPVRRIFKGDRKIGFKGAVGVQDLQLNESKGPAFRYAERAATAVGFLHSGRAYASPTFRSIQSTGRLAGDVKRNRDAQRTVDLEPEERIPARGRPNSRRPVIRVEGLGRVTGNFRELSEPGKLAISQIYTRVNGRTARGDLTSALTARGRYELKTGRAVTPEGELGGTLRDSIHSEGPFVSRGEVYGFVSAAAFNEKGFNYALAQEIGTAHNRPQPYLRPALRELRDQIVSAQRNALGTALKNAKNGSRSNRGFRRTLKLQVQFVDFSRIWEVQ
jgi:hypothetical protein